MYCIERFANDTLTYCKEFVDWEKAMEAWGRTKAIHQQRFKGVEVVFYLVKLGNDIDEDDVLGTYVPQEII